VEKIVVRAEEITGGHMIEQHNKMLPCTLRKASDRQLKTQQDTPKPVRSWLK
jgi:hypothetical protein